MSARPKTNKVLSNIDLIITFITLGFLYGGSSIVKKDGNPFNIVLDKILLTIRVIKILRSISKVRIPTLNKELNNLLSIIKNILIIDINAGNLPLHGINELVIIAINLSLLIYYSCISYSYCITSKPHTHSKCLFPAGISVLKITI